MRQPSDRPSAKRRFRPRFRDIRNAGAFRAEEERALKQMNKPELLETALRLLRDNRNLEDANEQFRISARIGWIAALFWMSGWPIAFYFWDKGY